MTAEEIKKIAVVCAETKMSYIHTNWNDSKRRIMCKGFSNEAEEVLQNLTERYFIVEKSKVEKLDIAYRAKHYHSVVLSEDDVEYLFGSEIRKEEENA